MTLPPVTTILFDVGNTLHHLDHAFIAAVISRHGRAVDALGVARAEYGAKAAIDEHMRAARRGTDASRQRSYYDSIMDTLGVDDDVRATIARELREENDRSSLWRVMHPETPDVLRRLRERGLTLGVVSNADGRVPAALEASGIAPFFRAIIDSHLVGVEKPDPRIFALALDQCGAAAAETVYVGDIYEIDIQGARGAGLTPVLLDPLTEYGEVDCLRIDRLGRLLDLLTPGET
jgi:putative hydrolase of the HAD superfamily